MIMSTSSLGTCNIYQSISKKLFEIRHSPLCSILTVKVAIWVQLSLNCIFFTVINFKKVEIYAFHIVAKFKLNLRL